MPAGEGLAAAPGQQHMWDALQEDIRVHRTDGEEPSYEELCRWVVTLCLLVVCAPASFFAHIDAGRVTAEAKQVEWTNTKPGT